MSDDFQYGCPLNPSASADKDLRPWPRPAKPWLIRQTWRHALFLHWPADIAALRPLVPARLEIDTHDGVAWISVIGLEVRGARPRGLPALPWLSTFAQINVRTYVRRGDRPGVLFLRVEVAGRLAATIARGFLHLPFHRARVSLRYEGWEWALACRSKDVLFAARYVQEGADFQPAPGTLEHWLTERFCFYTAGRKGRISRGEIDHPPWKLFPAQARVIENRWPAALGLERDEPPALAHYCRRQEARLWWPDRLA